MILLFLVVLQILVRSGIIDPDTRVIDHGRETVHGRVSLLQPVSSFSRIMMKNDISWLVWLAGILAIDSRHL